MSWLRTKSNGNVETSSPPSAKTASGGCPEPPNGEAIVVDHITKKY